VHITFYGIVITAVSDGTTVAMNLTDTIEGQSASAFAFGLPVGTCGAPVSPQTGTVAGVVLAPA
jgi:hypothetical protein